MQLEGIAAPPIGAACTGGMACDADPGVVSRDYLATLTRGQGIVCTVTPGERKKPKIARCMMEGVDLSCAMVADGMATATMALNCPPLPRPAQLTALERSAAALPALWIWVPLYLLVINIVTFGAFALDRYRAARAMNRVAPTHLLVLGFFGGGIGGLLAMWRLDHLGDEPAFTQRFVILVGLQIGALLGVIGL